MTQILQSSSSVLKDQLEEKFWKLLFVIIKHHCTGLIGQRMRLRAAGIVFRRYQWQRTAYIEISRISADRSIVAPNTEICLKKKRTPSESICGLAGILIVVSKCNTGSILDSGSIRPNQRFTHGRCYWYRWWGIWKEAGMIYKTSL